MSNDSYILYGAEISYFTGKVRAYLRWKGIPFEEVLSDAKVYKEVIVPGVGFPVIPVMATPEGEIWQDSTDMIDALEARFPQLPIYPQTPVQRLVAMLLEVYGDEWLVIPAMHYRWHYNRDWAIRQFGAVNAPDASPEEQHAIGEKRAGPFAGAAVLLGAEPHMHQAVETSYEHLLGELDAHFAEHNYLLGSRPSIGDFGLYGPLYAHQYRDPESGKLMQRLAPNVVAWIERMRDVPQPNSGEFLPNDEIPRTLLPILRRMMKEQLPTCVDLAEQFNQWLADNPNEEKIPRVIGKHEFELEGERGQRIMRVYSLWMLQRARRTYLALGGDDKEAADKLLNAVGGEAFKNFVDPPALARAGMSVALA